MQKTLKYEKHLFQGATDVKFTLGVKKWQHLNIYHNIDHQINDDIQTIVHTFKSVLFH
jgi:hypothetical protein